MRVFDVVCFSILTHEFTVLNIIKNSITEVQRSKNTIDLFIEQEFGLALIIRIFFFTILFLKLKTIFKCSSLHLNIRFPILVAKTHSFNLLKVFHVFILMIKLFCVKYKYTLNE